MFRAILAVGLILALSGCDEDEKSVDYSAGAILALGDSVVAWNAEEGASIPDALAAALGEPVVNVAVSGARVTHPDPGAADWGGDIRTQYASRAWRWVIIEGGANDLREECECKRCEMVLDQLIAADARSGSIPNLAERAVSDGARVALMGYYMPIQGRSYFENCGDEAAELSRRLALLSKSLPRSVFVDAADLTDPTTPEDYDEDRIHPSPATSIRIGQALAEAIRAAE